MSLNDPRWGNRDNNGERGGQRGDEQGPPDLEEIWRDFNQRLFGLFGRRREGNGPSGPVRIGPPAPSFRQFGGGLVLLVLLVLVIWLGSGFYTVDTKERGVVLRLGKYSAITDPGLHWRLPWPIEAHEIVDLTSLRTVSVGSRGNARALMLTDDLNIVAVQFAVQYVLKADSDYAGEDGRGPSPKDFLFNNRDPNDEFVSQIAETAMREIVGNSKMDFVLYEGKAKIANDAQKLIQEILDRYVSGIKVSRVTMGDVQPPEQVRDAFDDATRATQDWERQKNEGEAYANSVIPAAEGRASRLRADAEASRDKVIANAEGEAARFRQVLAEFKRAPQVTRERMYLDTMQQVLSTTSKVMVDNKGSGNLLYLPLDKLGAHAAAGVSPATSAAPEPAQTTTLPAPSPDRDSPRSRDFLRERRQR